MPKKIKRKQKLVFWKEYEARAVLRRLRISWRKIKPILDVIRHKKVEDALMVLDVMPKRGARPVAKLIRSCISNWQNKFGADAPVGVDDLYISEIYVTHGGMLKRWRPAPRGRAHMYRRRLSHVFVKVAPLAPQETTSEQKNVTETATDKSNQG